MRRERCKSWWQEHEHTIVHCWKYSIIHVYTIHTDKLCVLPSSLSALPSQQLSVQPCYGTSKNLGPKKFCVRKTFRLEKKFWSEKNFVSENIFGSQKNFWSERTFGPKKSLGQKKYWIKKICGPKIFGSNNHFGSDMVWVQENFGSPYN